MIDFEKMSEKKFDMVLMLTRVLSGAAAIAVVLFWLAMLSACKHAEVIAPPPPQANCDSLCYVACVDEDGDTGIRWNGSPVDAKSWDALTDEVVVSLAEKLRTCEVNRKACTKCLDSLEKNEVIVQ